MTTSPAWIAESGTYRKRIVRRRTISFDGERVPGIVTDPDGTEYTLETVSNGVPQYIPSRWLTETADPEIGEE